MFLTNPTNFQDRLELAFRGDAGEQSKTRREFNKSRLEKLQGFFGGRGIGFGLSPKTAEKISGSNVFQTKNNLGGTNRLTR